MRWLRITRLQPGDACPKCKRGSLFVRSSRPSGLHMQLRYLRCKNCRSTFKGEADRGKLRRAKKVL